jgi:iron complex outermembrane recepter protein
MKPKSTLMAVFVAWQLLSGSTTLAAGTEDDELADEFALLEEDSVVELAARHKQDIGMSPSAITVITREDIETSGAVEITDLLRLVPGLEVVRVNSAWSSTSARLKWTFENNQHLVLVDGREINFELLGEPVWPVQPIALEDIERIEVIRGPGSALYGANAVAGVISITTREVPERPLARLRLISGESGLLRAKAGGSIGYEDWRFSLGGEGDFHARFLDPRTNTRNIWKLRSTVSYALSESKKFLLDASFSSGFIPISSAMGTIDVDFLNTNVRLAYESEDLRAHFYWINMPFEIDVDTSLEYGGIELAKFAKLMIDSHVLDAEVQWTLPKLADPLLLIVGSRGRLSTVKSGQFIDADTFTDITSPDYHKIGINHYEIRGDVFAHAEYKPADWVVLNGSLRFDFNTITGWFLSPRLAVVFEAATGHFIRLGASRAFRKPAFLETDAHAMAEFPEGSPITNHTEFQEFMTRVLGNNDLNNEELTSCELGYFGRFLEGKINVSLDFYWNFHDNRISTLINIIEDAHGLPDLQHSYIRYENIGEALDIVGGELMIRYNYSRWISFLATWSHREVFFHDSGNTDQASPKNMLTFGGRFRTDQGLLGSLYLFIRTDSTDHDIENPAGLLNPRLSRQLGKQYLLISKLGWLWGDSNAQSIEAGIKLFLPISPAEYYEKGGVTGADGHPFGGEELGRRLLFYLQGSI